VVGGLKWSEVLEPETDYNDRLDATSSSAAKACETSRIIQSNPRQIILDVLFAAQAAGKEAW
jgi:hypothetical protein